MRCYEGQRRIACGLEREREREVERERERERERMTERDFGIARPSFAFGTAPSPPFFVLLVLVSICLPSEHLSLIYILPPPKKHAAKQRWASFMAIALLPPPPSSITAVTVHPRDPVELVSFT